MTTLNTPSAAFSRKQPTVQVISVRLHFQPRTSKKSRVAHPRLFDGSNFCFRSVQKKTNKKTTWASMTAGLFLAHFLGKGTFGGSLLLVPICSPACTDQAALSRLCSAVFAQSVWSANEVEGKWLRFSRDTTGLFSDIDWAFYNSLSLFLSISFFYPLWWLYVCIDSIALTLNQSWLLATN